MVDFQARIRESGPATVITIPATYIKDGHLKVGKLYRFTAVEVEEVNDDAAADT